ncbi:MAG: hypothetical protein ACRCZS_20900 [Chroococcidiopsis sp.]
MTEIQRLTNEIESYQQELTKLKTELSAASQVIPKVQSDSAADISSAFRAAAVATHERASDIQGIRNAIAELTTRLNQKQIQFEELEKEQQKQARVKRVEAAQQKLREQVEKIDDIASLLESAYYDLKAIYKEANSDFKANGSAAPGSYAYGMHQLIHFEFPRLPVLIEKDGSFTLGSRVFDLFEPEKKAEQAERAARSRAYRLERERELTEIKQRELDEKLRIERQEAAALLKNKRSQLEAFRAERARWLAGLATANVSDFDDAIAKLEAEIENLQKPVPA